MKQLEEVQRLYETDLKQALLALEPLRKSIARPILFILALFGIVAAGCYLAGLFRHEGFVVGFCIAGILVLIIGIALGAKKYKIYRRKFKEQVVSEILKIINPEWAYDYDAHISRETYFESELFKHSVDRYRGDDRVRGKIGKTDFEMSELHTLYKTVTHDSKGNRQENWHTIFQGLFFHADFNKQVKGKTFVLPDAAQKLFGSFGQKLQEMNKNRGQLVKMENTEFEKKFVVYGSDQIEPRYILTPKIMENLVELSNTTRRPMHLSFVGNRVFVAVSFNKPLFEPKLFRNGVRFEDITEMYQMFSMIQLIVEEMDLNTRIWTKS